MIWIEIILWREKKDTADWYETSNSTAAKEINSEQRSITMFGGHYTKMLRLTNQNQAFVRCVKINGMKSEWGVNVDAQMQEQYSDIAVHSIFQISPNHMIMTGPHIPNTRSDQVLSTEHTSVLLNSSPISGRDFTASFQPHVISTTFTSRST